MCIRDRIVSIAVAEELRERLKNADAELTAMTLMLEAQRQKAEETLTLLAAADSARSAIAVSYTHLTLPTIYSV